MSGFTATLTPFMDIVPVPAGFASDARLPCACVARLSTVRPYLSDATFSEKLALVIYPFTCVVLPFASFSLMYTRVSLDPSSRVFVLYSVSLDIRSTSFVSSFISDWSASLSSVAYVSLAPCTESSLIL